MAVSTLIQSALRVVDGTPEVLEASVEGYGWRVRVVRDGREASSRWMSKWQHVESAFQIFALGMALAVPDAGPEHAIST